MSFGTIKNPGNKSRSKLRLPWEAPLPRNLRLPIKNWLLLIFNQAFYFAFWRLFLSISIFLLWCCYYKKTLSIKCRKPSSTAGESGKAITALERRGRSNKRFQLYWHFKRLGAFAFLARLCFSHSSILEWISSSHKEASKRESMTPNFSVSRSLEPCREVGLMRRLTRGNPIYLWGTTGGKCLGFVYFLLRLGKDNTRIPRCRPMNWMVGWQE